MSSRSSQVVRLLGIALLLLAVSPLTAPFSTCDLIDILGDATAPATTSVQAKHVADEPAAEIGRADGLAPDLVSSSCACGAAVLGVRTATPLDLPLRL